MTAETIFVPDLGGAESVEVIELCVAEGDSVELEQSLIVLESDKATMDVPSPQIGIIKKMLVAEGDTVSEGTPIAEIETASVAAGKTEAANPETATSDPAPEAVAEQSKPASQGTAEQKATVPDTGTDEPLEIIELSVAEGDVIAEGDGIVVVETDKATMEVPASCGGTIKQLLVKVGDRITSGDVLAVIVGASADGETSAISESSDAPAVAEAELPVAEPAAPSASAVAAEQDVLVPDTGGADAVEVIEIAAESGATLSEGDGILVVETDKATMELPAPFDGELLEVLVNVGDKVSTGDRIARMRTSAPDQVTTPTASEAAPETQVAPAEAPATAPTPVPAETKEKAPAVSAGDVYAGPASRALARELGVDLSKVSGSGPRGRILKEDLHNYVKQAVAKAESAPVMSAGGAGIPAIPDVDFSKFGEIEMIPLQKIHKLTAANMQRSWLNVPHVTQFDDADITDLEVFRASLKQEAEKRGTKLTPLPFLLKACAHALAANPEFNRSITANGEHFVQKKYIHIGIAVDTPRGLVVPVIRDVDSKGLWQLADETNELAAKAREGKLTATDMQGGCFTISSLGAIGGNGFTPIVNAPEAAILGVSKSQTKPVWNGSEFVPRLLLPLSVSYDHRIINGADCGRFFTYLTAVLGDIRRLAL
ncbi:dihydrolipoyllysine-residue acetyltransferase [Porticoccus litoralis]|uniref:Acetyltransferase component of pyruvate dehydrogenase complex n=1 Tax=Porticoccus litoralis TaxID=434086 RepID=A0AAW8B2I1_9GAMM|nr:dihydrolipoyllysine-residue acetyltransferase [Porticoccus litoralis]MDP1519971.1 dihydrolipoyllysine-residue acetyltransferase [Porticoccus litoralis]